MWPYLARRKVPPRAPVPVTGHTHVKRSLFVCTDRTHALGYFHWDLCPVFLGCGGPSFWEDKASCRLGESSILPRAGVLGSMSVKESWHSTGQASHCWGTLIEQIAFISASIGLSPDSLEMPKGICLFLSRHWEPWWRTHLNELRRLWYQNLPVCSVG